MNESGHSTQSDKRILNISYKLLAGWQTGQKNPKYIIQASDRMADRTKNRMADLQRKQEESLDALSLTR